MKVWYLGCLIFAIGMTSCAHKGTQTGEATSRRQFAEYDLVLDGIPRQVELIDVGSFSNAVEGDSGGLDRLEAIVAFRVVDVLKGEGSGEAGRRKSLPRFNPAHFISSLAKGNFEEVMKPSAVRVDQDIRSRWFRIAVKDPYESFGIASWDQPEPITHRIYLKQLPHEDDTYIMVRSERR